MNPLHAVALSAWQWLKLPTSDPALHEDIRRYGIVVAGTPSFLTVPARA